MHESGTPGRQVLQSALAAVAGRLDGASVRRSVVEQVIDAHGCTEDLRGEVEAALRVARIKVVEDAVVARKPTPRAPSTTLAHRDPCTFARDRLAADRTTAPHRRAKIILSAEEEVALTLLARPDGKPLDAGGFSALQGEAREAADAMLLHNMGLVHSVAQRLGGQGLEYDDLVSSGIPGLVRAIELFDPHRALKFSTYAMHWIRQSITRAVANEGRAVRLPVHMYDTVRAVMATRERMTADGRAPSLRDLAAECHLSQEKLAEVLRLAPGAVSLETPLGNDGFTLGDLVDAQVDRPEQIVVGGLYPEDLPPLLAELKPRERDVLARRHGLDPYGEASTLEEIGVEYGVSRERIRQIESKALEKVRAHLRVKGFTVSSPPTRRTKQGAAQDLPPSEDAEALLATA